MLEQRDNAANDAGRRDLLPRQGLSSRLSGSRPATAPDTQMESQGCRARATETSTPGSRRGPEDNRMDVDTINIVVQILPDWEINTVTNLPIHMWGCTDCALFVKHVRQNLQGRSLCISRTSEEALVTRATRRDKGAG
jgi:hypothetical protein